ncbi:NEDD4 family-interacting protein 1-like isoform X2 [Teleopsis dalmanni]|nr:NEDD4 family-interacting protein 1-like isoform X2 [Teleopsis dalmanni]XP_037933745.1 NEDD4 family-interacting protein 1-like isoform X2 [Teleopsis dalmanni]
MSENHQSAQELGPPKADFSAPPPYELTNSSALTPPTQPLPLPIAQQQQHQQQQQQQQHLHLAQNETQQLSQDINLLTQQQQFQQDVPQIHHSKLPTYEEVQMEKSLNGELPPAFLTTHTLHQPPPPPNPLLPNIRDGTTAGGAPPALTFIAIDASDAENLTNSDNSLLGTDIMFITAFMVAFLFNWVGFLMLTCFCHTIAARYGALSGFGLSLAKWTLIVKNSTDLASHENSWLWWLIMVFGLLICVRALIQYVSIKRTWRLLSTSAQERLLFFY